MESVQFMIFIVLIYWYIHIFMQGTNVTSAQICFEDAKRDEQHPSEIHLDVFYVPDFVLGDPGVWRTLIDNTGVEIVRYIQYT